MLYTKTVQSLVMAYCKPEHLHAAASYATEKQVGFDRNNSCFHCLNERLVMMGV
jgi:L-rhamnose isomerase